MQKIDEMTRRLIQVFLFPALAGLQFDIFKNEVDSKLNNGGKVYCVPLF